MIRSVIIEDEKPAARYLQKIAEAENIIVEALLHSVAEAIHWLQHHNTPDIIFLDIQLGDGISFEIFQKVQPKSAIIFTTAYDEYAIKAFKFNAIDYLLKPINKAEFHQAIEKYKKSSQTTSIDLFQIQQLLQTNFESKYRERFLVKVGTNLKTFETKNIACFYSRDKTTYLFTENREFPLEHSVSELSEQLNPKQYFQISRSAIVNLHFIDNIISYSGNRFKIQIKNISEELIVSRERVADFKFFLQG